MTVEVLRSVDGVVTTLDAKQLARSIDDLGSLPTVCARLSELMKDAEASRIEIENVISHDPGLTARLLRLANSERYGAQGQVESVAQAVAMVEPDELSQLLTDTTPEETFDRIPPELVDMENFWHHSVCCGLAARELCVECGGPNPGRLFVLGLLHDIGQLVLYHGMPAYAQGVLERAGEPESYRYRAEREMLGFTHAEVGSELLRNWGYPASLWEPVAFHHEPAKARDYELETALVHIATGLSDVFEPSWNTQRSLSEATATINKHAWWVTGLSPAVVETILLDLTEDSFSVLEVISPGSNAFY